MGHLNLFAVSILTTAIFWQCSIQSILEEPNVAALASPLLVQEPDAAAPQLLQEPIVAAQASPPLIQEPNAGAQSSPPFLEDSNVTAQASTAFQNSNSSNSIEQFSPPRGSNMAEYEEPCISSNIGPGKPCNPLKDLICYDGICKCQRNVLDPDAPLVYASMSAKCLPIATSKRFWSCSDDSQCSNSKYGRFSRCNTNIGAGNGKCECFDTEELGREILFIDDVCYVKKELDQKCISDMECNATIAGEAICQGLGNRATTAGVCKCADEHKFEPSYKECLKLGTLHSVCKSNFQCQHIEALGELSRCHETSKICDCWDTKNVGQKDTKFYKGRCHYSRGINETCDDKIECVLGYHTNADCLVHPSYDGGKICLCTPGADCSIKNSCSVPSASLIFIIVGIFSYVFYSVYGS